MGFFLNYARNLAAVALGRQPARPLLFSYYITHRCNLNCRYCCDGDGKRFREDPIPELTTAEAKQLLSILRRSSDTLDITGGEPMLRHDLEEVLEHAQRLGLRTVLNTKAIGLPERQDVLRFTDVLVVSVDSLDVTHLAQLMDRPVSVAQRVLDALEFAIAKRAELPTKLVLSSVATPVNLDEVERVMRFALDNELGFHVSPEIVGTTANPELRTCERYRDLVDTAIEAKRSASGVLGVPQYLRGIRDFERFPCHPLLMATIRPDGRLYYPCLEHKQADVSILECGSYEDALRVSRKRRGGIPQCGDCCHVFCHMALSLFQRHPLAALGETRHWRAGSDRPWGVQPTATSAIDT